MRKTLCPLAVLVFAVGLASAQTSASPKADAANAPSAAVLADGTLVKLRVGAAINTNSLRVGDELDLDVAEEIRINDVSVIPTSSVARVVVMSQGLDAAKTGKADVSLRYLLLADGEKVSLRSTRERKAGAGNTAVVSAGEGDVTISNGAEVTAYINGNLPLDLPKLRLANQPTNELKIGTTPSNAEVSVDGKVLGSTPFSGRVAHGEHVVAIRMAGFEAWKQNVRVTAEPTVLQIPLKKQDGLENIPQPVAAAPSLGDLARAARAKKAADNSPKAAGEPLELLPEESKHDPEPQGTPQTPALHPEQRATPAAANSAVPAAAAAGAPDAAQPGSSTSTTPAQTTTPPTMSPQTTPAPAATPQAASQPGGTPQPGAPSQTSTPAQPAAAPAASQSAGSQPATAQAPPQHN